MRRHSKCIWLKWYLYKQKKKKAKEKEKEKIPSWKARPQEFFSAKFQFSLE